MSQSKMSVTDDTEKKFVIKHVFKDVMNMKTNVYEYSPKEFHCGIPWKLVIRKTSTCLEIYIKCDYQDKNQKFSIDVDLNLILSNKNEPNLEIQKKRILNQEGPNYFDKTHIIDSADLENYLVDGNLTVEYQVKINKAIGVGGKLRSFDNELAKKYSDVMLKIGDQKFYVHKMYLASQSTYFEALFLGNFLESEKSEIELKDIDPYVFQKFLEVLYGESAIDEDLLAPILSLSDMYNSTTVVSRCQEFLIYRSKESLTEKFQTAVKYDMHELMKKCMSEMKTVEEFKSVVPTIANDFSPDVWKELYLKALEIKI